MKADIEVILQDYAENHRHCSQDTMREHLREHLREHRWELGHEMAARSIHNYFDETDIKLTKQYIEPKLSSKQKLARLDSIFDRRDKVKNSSYHSARNQFYVCPATPRMT